MPDSFEDYRVVLERHRDRLSTLYSFYRYGGGQAPTEPVEPYAPRDFSKIRLRRRLLHWISRGVPFLTAAGSFAASKHLDIFQPGQIRSRRSFLAAGTLGLLTPLAGIQFELDRQRRQLESPAHVLAGLERVPHFSSLPDKMRRHVSDFFKSESAYSQEILSRSSIDDPSEHTGWVGVRLVEDAIPASAAAGGASLLARVVARKSRFPLMSRWAGTPALGRRVFFATLAGSAAAHVASGLQSHQNRRLMEDFGRRIEEESRQLHQFVEEFRRQKTVRRRNPR